MSRKLLLLLLIPGLLLLGAYLYLRVSLSKANKEDEKITGTTTSVDSLGGKKVSAADLRPLLIERMQQLLRKSSQGLYNLSVGDMKLDVLASTVSLQNVTLSTDSSKLNEQKAAGTLPSNVFKVRFKELVVEGINLDDALTSKTMDYKLLRLVNPVIEVFPNKQGQKKNETAEDFSQRFLKEMTKLEIGRLEIVGGTIIAHGAKNKTNRLNEVDIELNKILLDSITRTDKGRFLFAENATINFRNYTTQTSDGLYQFKIGKGTITSPQQQVRLQNISLASPLSREQFVKRQKLAKELYQLSLSSLTLNKVDWWTLFNGEEVVAEDLQASGGKLSIYFDRSLPLRSRLGNFPNQLLAKTELKMNVDRFAFQNLDFSYTEYNPVSKQSGSIYFDNIKLQGTNLSTTNTKPLRIEGSGLFMKQVPVSTLFTFDMKKPQAGGFTVSVSSEKPFATTLINSFSMPLGLMKMEKGTLNKLTATINGDQAKAQGNVTVLYSDLKLSLLEKEKDQKALDKKDVTSLLANLFVIKNDNPRKGALSLFGD
ncbi:MAG TPA: hypothetical protein VMR70_04070, partial [Flavisolibacter sp.]|nr:hypothetical protein [Flavisolibacter sp.]